MSWASMPQSILKGPSDHHGIVTSSSEEDRIRATALYHAKIIQQRKDIEARILRCLENLLELPSSSTADSSHPSAEDLETLSTNLSLFQPADFDELIHERSITDKCGYVFCPNPNKKQRTNAKYRIIRSRKGNFSEPNIVKTSDLEKWCSEDCSRRAQYLRAQLDEEPAWTRQLSKDRQLRVLCNRTNDNEGAIVCNMEELHLASDVGASRDEALALERGEAGAVEKSARLVTLRENASLNPEEHSDGFDQLEPHEVIEGYQTRAPGPHSKFEPQDLLGTI